MYGYIWWNGQFKPALLISEGRKWTHFVVLTHTGVRKVRVKKADASISSPITDPVKVRAACVRYLDSSQDVTLGAERAIRSVMTLVEENENG